jgi:DNA replicative helicase MCM subunit Mcm2 (Cdc46/Mcm family)
MRTNKQYFAYCVKENILIFDVFDYLEELAADTVDYFNDWNLVKDGVIQLKSKILRQYLEERIKFDILIINNKSRKINCRVLCFYKQQTSFNVWSSFFEDPNKFIKVAKRLAKKFLPNFVEISNEKSLFQDVNGTFNNLPVVLPTGEDQEFLNKKLKKLKFSS